VEQQVILLRVHARGAAERAAHACHVAGVRPVAAERVRELRRVVAVPDAHVIGGQELEQRVDGVLGVARLAERCAAERVDVARLHFFLGPLRTSFSWNSHATFTGGGFFMPIFMSFWRYASPPRQIAAMSRA